MALGRPVIATRVGGNPELLGTDGRCGLLVAPRDFLEFANKIEFLMRDSDLRRTMGDQGIERVKELCGLERYIDSYEKLFMDVAGIHPAVEEGIRSASVRA
jgi:glycosyltransferase involved in cell wall biosynthesis